MLKVIKKILALLGVKEKLYAEIDKLDAQDAIVEEFIDEVQVLAEKIKKDIEAGNDAVDIVQDKLKKMVNKFFTE